MRSREWCLSPLYLIQSFTKKVGIAASSDDEPTLQIITCPGPPPPVTSLEHADLATSKFAMPRNYFLKDSCISSVSSADHHPASGEMKVHSLPGPNLARKSSLSIALRHFSYDSHAWLVTSCSALRRSSKLLRCSGVSKAWKHGLIIAAEMTFNCL